jgi:hypothetical protein
MIIGLAVALAALGAAVRMTGRARTEAAHLGWMSERWVAEHRAVRLGRTD